MNTLTLTRRAEQARRESVFQESTRYRELASLAVDADQPRWLRRRAQRALRREQYQIVAELDAWRDADGRPYTADEPARYRDSRGQIGVDRYIRSVLGMYRRSRRAPAHTPWGRLLQGWTPERRCAGTFAEDAQGQPVHHDDPSACRWCLAGWLAHRCQKPSKQQPHRRVTEDWTDRIDDREARRLLGEVWESLPVRTRAITESIWRARTTARERKELHHHPLGYWWMLAPHLAERWLQIEPSRIAPLTLAMLTRARRLQPRIGP